MHIHSQKKKALKIQIGKMHKPQRYRIHFKAGRAKFTKAGNMIEFGSSFARKVPLVQLEQ